MKIRSDWVVTEKLVADAIISLMASKGFSAEDFAKGRLGRPFWVQIAASFNMTREKLMSFIKKHADEIRSRILEPPKGRTP